MNRYIAKKDIIIRTTGGRRIRIQKNMKYDGGFDFRNPEENKSVLFVIVDGHKDEVVWPAGNEFISNFKFLYHVDKPEYTKVEQVKRQRICQK